MYALDIKQGYYTVTISLEDYDKAANAARTFVDAGCEAVIRLANAAEEEV